MSVFVVVLAPLCLCTIESVKGESDTIKLTSMRPITQFSVALQDSIRALECETIGHLPGRTFYPILQRCTAKIMGKLFKYLNTLLPLL